MVNAFSLSAGVLVESDIVSLSTGLLLEPPLLIDSANGARHTLHPTAARALAHIAQPIAAGTWLRELDGLGVTAKQANEIISFLNDIGGLRVQHSILGSITFGLQRLGFYLQRVPLAKPAHRVPATIPGITYATARAMAPFALLFPSLAVLLYAIGLPLSTVLLLSVLAAATLGISTVSHEYAHAAVLQGQARASAAILQRGTRLGILHTKMGLKRELTSALLGPMVGCISAIVICGGAWLVTKQDVCLIVGILACIAHIFSLLPFYGDGKTIRDYIKDPQYEKAT